MKKLCLAKPDVRLGYLEFGRGQEVRYLNIDNSLGLKELKSDIANGAVQFTDLAQYIEKKPSRVNIIYCNKEEDGLMAVSYLSAVYNRMDKLNPNAFDEDISLEETQNYDFADFEELDSFFEDELDDDAEMDSGWQENPWKIPIIASDSLVNDHDMPFSTFAVNDYNYSGLSNSKNRLPYWYNLRKENICIVHNMTNQYLAPPISLLSKSMRRYQNNRHIFVVVVLAEDKMLEDCDEVKYIRGAFCEVVLEYVAGTVNIHAKENEYIEYYKNVFENLVYGKGFSLANAFPIEKLVDSILNMNNSDKASLLEKVVQYTIKDEGRPRELCESDFDILKQFESLGLSMADKEHKSVEKLKNELVGMHSVKEQITGIVEVLKYNKRRLKMGLPTGSYHNIHMMLGAPGTAKTTVAELLGNIMAEEHLLRGNRFISVNGAELKGMYVGHSAPKVKALFDEYDIIFIDEAYAICAGNNGESDSFSQEAIAQLIVELEKHGMDRLVMFAGYGGRNVSERDNKMKEFLNANPGIRSRINSTIFFDSYTPDEMVQIFQCHAKLGKYTLSKKADNLVREYFAERVKAKDFGNGREARSLLENSMAEAAMRLSLLKEDEISKKMMQEIKIQDIEAAIKKLHNGTLMQNGRGMNRLGFAAY